MKRGAQWNWILPAILVFTLPGAGAFSATKNKQGCTGLSKEIELMQKAQRQLLKGLVKKNQLLAEKLEKQSEKLSSSSHQASQLEALDLRKSARLLRDQQVKEERISSKFQLATLELMQKVQNCLKAKGSTLH